MSYLRIRGFSQMWLAASASAHARAARKEHTMINNDQGWLHPGPITLASEKLPRVVSHNGHVARIRSDTCSEHSYL
jgi:hypothetical protein